MRRRMMRKKPRKAFLDGDILAYQTAFWAEVNDPDDFPIKLEKLVKQWTPDGVDGITIALSCSRVDNFRRNIWPDYKANREDLYIPEYLLDVKDHMRYKYKCKELPSLEADDILGIYTYSNKAIAVTIDKDLKGVCGWHYNPRKDEELRFITKKEARRFFFEQWMTGDSVDGLPGLWRIGPKTAQKMLEEWDEGDWEGCIIELYTSDKYKPKKKYDMSSKDVAVAMAQCVNILTTETYNLKTNKISLWVPKDG